MASPALNHDRRATGQLCPHGPVRHNRKFPTQQSFRRLLGLATLVHRAILRAGRPLEQVVARIGETATIIGTSEWANHASEHKDKGLAPVPYVQ
jgi:hypothetical protein